MGYTMEVTKGEFMFKYDVYSYEDGSGFEIELSDYPNKMKYCSHVIFSFYLNSMGMNTQLNEEVDTSFITDTFVSPEDVEVLDGIISIQGNLIYN